MTVSLLIEHLKTVPDWRRGRAVQHPLWLMLLMTLLGVMSGYTSLRGLADFMLRHQIEVTEHFQLAKAKLPRYSTIRDMASHVDVVTVVAIFMTWAKTHPVPDGQGVALDGKALGSTVQDCYGSAQNFVNVVSACVHGRADVIGQISFENGKTSEIGAVRDLLKQLDVVGVWFTLDALHCQKNG
jgi:DDE_Tnp_1-associated